jgi:hypothetical protein
MDANGPSGESWPPDVEGTLIAHRRVLELLLATLAAAGAEGGALLDDIERRLAGGDAQEDPGVEPDGAFAVQRAADAEVRRLIREARAMAAAAGR